MTFTAGFYSFNVHLNDSSRSVYTSFRVKTPRHPEESLGHLYTRVLAFSHNYEDGLLFSQGLFEPKEPSIWKKDALGNLEVWIDLGVPEQKKLERALKQFPNARFKIYFSSHEEVVDFCWMLRGSKSNWVEGMHFYLFDPLFLESISEFEQTSAVWDLSILDSSFYLTAYGQDFQSSIKEIDIWDEFQMAIRR